MPSAAGLAQSHWNETPLFLSETERYSQYPWLYDVAEFRLHSGEKVLEIGCGTGCDLLQFAKHGALATGVDITEKHLELARQRVGKMAEVVKSDMRQLPFASESFDYVYSHGVIHHSDEPAKVASEILRVLKPGGQFNIHVYSLFSLFTLSRFVKYGMAWKKHIENSTSEVHIDLYTAKNFSKLFPSCPIQFSKQECYRVVGVLTPWLGWYLVAKGQKPREITRSL